MNENNNFDPNNLGNTNTQYEYNSGQQAEENEQYSYTQYGAQNNGDPYAGGNQYTQFGAVPPAHNKAVASLVLGIVGLCCCGVCSIIALVLAIKAKNEGNNESIRTAGFVLGVIGVVICVVGFIVSMVTGVFTAINTTDSL